MCCLSRALISLAVRPRPEILVRQVWVNARDLTAAGGPREQDLRKLGLIRSTSPQARRPRLGSDPGVRTHRHHCGAMHVFSTPAEPQSY